MFKKEVLSNTIGNFISNNVKGIHSSDKKLKIFEYLKNNIHHNGFVRNTLIDTIDSNNWKDDFNGPLFFFTW